jgi:hypothetical protein
MEAENMKRILLLGVVLALSWASSATASPVAPEHPLYRESCSYSPCILNEQRDERFQNLLIVSVRISVHGAAGSGTICHYDRETGWAYVISCGHLWSGDMNYSPNGMERAKITTWYQDGPRLASPASYEAEVLFWSNKRGQDVSLLRFKPDWECSFAPISMGASTKVGMHLNSMGCDGGKEVARYEVVVKSTEGADLVTRLNSPRPGRSGGGLLTDDGLLVGVCWGTSDVSSGDGIGFFTPISAISEVFTKNEHAWLLSSAFDPAAIPVVDRENPEARYDRHFVPRPSN